MEDNILRGGGSHVAMPATSWAVSRDSGQPGFGRREGTELGAEY